MIYFILLCYILISQWNKYVYFCFKWILSQDFGIWGTNQLKCHNFLKNLRRYLKLMGDNWIIDTTDKWGDIYFHILSGFFWKSYWRIYCSNSSHQGITWASRRLVSLIIISAPITTWDRGGGEGLPQGFSGLNTKKKNNHLELNVMNNPRNCISGDTINNPGQKEHKALKKCIPGPWVRLADHPVPFAPVRCSPFIFHYVQTIDL